MVEKVFLETEDKIKLAGIWHEPDRKNGKAIILCHGITVNKDENGIFIDLAKRLTESGYAVLRFDFRGHGESGGKSVNMTLSGELEDLKAALGFVQNKGYGNIGLLGASFGGGIATLFAAEKQNKLQALCLWNPVLNYDHTLLNPTLPWILSRKAHMKKDMAEKGWTELGSRKFVVGKKLFDEMAVNHPFKKLREIIIPTVIFHGDKDTKVPFEDSQEYSRGLCPLVNLEGSEHGFHTEPFYSRTIGETVKFFQKYL